MSIPKRVAAIGVSHWHSIYDASYLPILRDLGCDIVGVSDRSERIATERAARFGSRPFADYRQMIETTRPEFVIALGRHCEMPEIFRFLVGAGVPFVMEKPWGTDPDTLAHFVTGEEPAVVSAVISRRVHEAEVEDYALVTLRTPRGILFHNEVGYTMPTTWPANQTDGEQKVAGEQLLL